MATRVYLSNLCALWPIERQEEVLAGALPGARVYRDVLTGRERMGRDTGLLVERDKALRGTTRKGDTLWVASLAVLDWTTAGLLNSLTWAKARGSTVQVVEPPMTIKPDAKLVELVTAAEAFEAAKKRELREVIRGKTGGEISGARRKAAAIERCKPIWDRWQRGNQREHPTAALLAEAGVTRNTAVEHMGKRKGTR